MTAHTLAPAVAPRTNRGSNRLAGSLLAIAAVAVFVAQAELRPIEARVTALAIGPFTAGHASSSGSVVFFGAGTDRVYGLDITPLCSTVVLVAPLLAIAGVVMVFGLRAQRVALGLLAALVLAAASNLARYIGAAVALQRFGLAGFDLVHEYLGSLLVIFGFAAAIVLLLWVATRDRRTRRTAGAAHRRGR
jgi:exosortase/archaeosortase family protein